MYQPGNPAPVPIAYISVPDLEQQSSKFALLGRPLPQLQTTLAVELTLRRSTTPTATRSVHYTYGGTMKATSNTDTKTPSQMIDDRIATGTNPTSREQLNKLAADRISQHNKHDHHRHFLHFRIVSLWLEEARKFVVPA